MVRSKLQRIALLVCFASSISVHVLAWVAAAAAPAAAAAAAGIRPMGSSCASSWYRSCVRSSEISRLWMGAADSAAGEADGEKPGAPAVEWQPWWEEETRTAGMPTLSKQTQWRMFLSLRDPAKGGEAGETTEVAVRVKFFEDKDFEPPQGSLEVIEDNPYFTRQAGKARWTLSEAEDTRGAGLWVWGLFKDPLYPFLLLQVNNLEINLKGGAKIEAGRLYVKVDHRRDDELGPTLKSGTVGVKLIERVQVDPLGMAEADISSVVPCGSVQFRPV